MMDKPETMLLPCRELILVKPEDNPNKMTDVEFEMLKQAMLAGGSEDGDEVLQPLLVAYTSERVYEVVDGAHRCRAAIELGWENIECKVVSGWDSARITAYRLGMNRNRGHVDLGIAAAIMTELKVEGWTVGDMVVTGFSADEIAELTKRSDEAEVLADAGSVEVEDIAAPADKPFVLEIEFRDRDEFMLAKRKLRKAAGKSKDMARGLMAVLGEET